MQRIGIVSGGHNPGAASRAGLALMFACSVTLLAGCSGLGGPDYQRPEVTSKQSWSQPDGVTVSAAAAIQPGWWTGFGDPYLNELIERAIADNIDIRILAARTGVAQAGIDQASAGLLPTLTGGAATDTFKVSGSPQNNADNPRTNRPRDQSNLGFSDDSGISGQREVAMQACDLIARSDTCNPSTPVRSRRVIASLHWASCDRS